MANRQKALEHIWSLHDSDLLDLWNTFAESEGYEVIYRNGREFLNKLSDGVLGDIIAGYTPYNFKDKYAYIDEIYNQVKTFDDLITGGPLDLGSLADWIVDTEMEVD